MTTPSKAPQKKTGGWGSLLSGAVANLESRLDTILAEDSEASARQRAAEAAARESKLQQARNPGLTAQGNAGTSREASRTRGNDRLAERLARATAVKNTSNAGSTVPSRVATPVNEATSASVRTSGESKRSTEIPRSAPEIPDPTGDLTTAQADLSKEKSTLPGSLPLPNPAKTSLESDRSAVEITGEATSSRLSLDLANGQPPSDNGELERELQRMQEERVQAEKQRQEEMHAYIERIDALQAKLQYLAKETVAAAKAANAETTIGSDAARLAEKDERIALLMEEGEKLSKNELRHMQTIKKLRAKATDEEKAAEDLRARLKRAERTESELRQKLRRAEAAERQANDKAKQISAIEQQVEELRVDRENASELIRNLTTQLKEAQEKADRAEKEAAEVDRNRIASLENDLEDAQIEKKLAEDRANAEIRKAQENAAQQQQRFEAIQTELKAEIASLESRFEAMRTRAEEATVVSGSAGEDGSVKLLRQLEILQSQYSLAKENWQTIEESLNSRVCALEKERDETVRRETETRKRLRDAAVGKRKADSELEAAEEKINALARELDGQKEEIRSLRTRLDQAEDALREATAEHQRQRKLWDAEVSQRLEEEKIKWQRSNPPTAQYTQNGTPSGLSSVRKTSAVDLTGMPNTIATRRLTSNRLPSSHDHHLALASPDSTLPRPHSSRSTGMPTPTTRAKPHSTSAEPSPSISRRESTLSMLSPSTTNHLPPPTPSFEIDADFEELSHTDSPNRTLAELLSTSTAAAGPSVQLVERLSTSVRRLEAEKASFKDEMARLASQRDEARDSVVALMRELEGRKGGETKAAKLERELAALKERYEGALELLGEREEEVVELRGDVQEVKAMYRRLVEERLPEKR